MATKKTTNNANTHETQTAKKSEKTNGKKATTTNAQGTKKAPAKKAKENEVPQPDVAQQTVTEEMPIAQPEPAPEPENTTPAKKTTTKKAMKNATAKAEQEPEKKLSALDAAAAVLAKAPAPMNSKDLVGAMAEQELWISPNGKTPHLTLSAAIQREILVKGNESRFKKTGPGRFSLN